MICDFCNVRPAELSERTVINNVTYEYHFCKECYSAMRASGRSTYEIMREKEARKGRECPVCGSTEESFGRSFLFGCPACYENMRGIAEKAAAKCQKGTVHTGKKLPPRGDK